MEKKINKLKLTFYETIITKKTMATNQYACSRDPLRRDGGVGTRGD